jgi:ethanolamine permease
VVGYALALLIYYLGKSEGQLAGQIVGALLYMAVFGAVISYFMQCLAFVMLRRKLPDIERPYRSPVGVPGAVIAGVIALVAFVSLFLNEDYRPGVVGTLIYFLIGIAYFAIRGRHKLVLSPEEEFAMTRGKHGAHLQQEGYGTTSVTEIAADSPPRSP